MTAKPATIEDVARRAGVSIATVSRALQKPDIVSKSTRDKVHAAVDALGYTANVMARNLRLRHTRMAVVLVPNIGNPFFSAILAGIESAASKRGYNILIGDTENDPAREREFAAYVRGHQADGLILLNGRMPPFRGDPLGGAMPPIVIACERIPGSTLPTVYFDNEGGARAATEHLISLGHRRIAHIAGPADNILTKDRIAGHKSALKAAGIRTERKLLVGGDFTIESGRQAIQELAKLKSFPSAIFCSNDEMAMGAIAALKEMNMRVPEDVSIVGFDDIQFADAIDPPLTTIHQPRDAIGRAAMNLLLDLIDEKTVNKAPQILGGPLKERGSAAPRER